MTRHPATPLPTPAVRRRVREGAALTQDQLAARVGVTRKTVRAWESGRTTPRGRQREAYAKLLAALAEEATGRQPAPPSGSQAAPALDPAPDPGGPAQEAATAPDLTASRSEALADAENQADAPDSACPGDSVDAEDPAGPGEATDTQHPVGPGDSTGNGDLAGPGDSTDAADSPVPPQGTLPAPGHQAPDPGTGTGTGTEDPAPDPTPDADAEQDAPTPAQAFDALYDVGAPALARQAYVLTGRRELARESVERAFHLAWERWPEVARDRDPVGWVRASVHEYALSPWHRFRPSHRHPEAPPSDPGDRTLLAALLRLPPRHRRTLLLYDGVGLDLPETAAETEASTPAAANRLLHAREALAEEVPEVADPRVLHRRLAELASAERLRPPAPPAVRTGGERRARLRTRAAIACTAALIGTTVLTVQTAPTHYEAPISPGQAILGVPPRVAQGPLSDEELELRQRLRDAAQDGPERLAPQSG